MNRIVYKRKLLGFTIPELTVTMFILSLFTLSLLGMLIMGMKTFRIADDHIATQILCRNAMDTMVSDIRQGVPNPDDGDSGSRTPTGYLSIVSPDPTVKIPATAILKPNINSPKKIDSDNIDHSSNNLDPAEFNFDNEIIFTVPIYEKKYPPYDNGAVIFNPLDMSFNLKDPRMYRQVRYYVDTDTKRILYREIRGFDSNGSKAYELKQPLVQIDTGEIELGVYYKGKNCVKLELRISTERVIGRNSVTGEPSYKDYQIKQEIWIANYY